MRFIRQNIHEKITNLGISECDESNDDIDEKIKKSKKNDDVVHDISNNNVVIIECSLSNEDRDIFLLNLVKDAGFYLGLFY